MAELRHIPVMLDEAVEGLAVQAGGRYLDGTFGRGGHARAVLSRLGPDGRLLLMDRDPTAIAAAREAFADEPRVAIRHGNFAELAEWDETVGGLDGVLLDLGVSSPQLDEAARGFSFMADAPLDMRMDTTQGESAVEFLARADKNLRRLSWEGFQQRAGVLVAAMLTPHHRENSQFGVARFATAEDFLGVSIFFRRQVVFGNQFRCDGRFSHRKSFKSER